MDGTTRWRWTGPSLVTAAWLGLVLVANGCSLDFNEAVPCESNDQCPPNFVCNLTLGRCEAGFAPPGDTGGEPDATPDTAGDPVEDLVADSVGDTAADPDTAGGDPDTVEEPVEDVATEPDEGNDGCVATAEVCNGLDDDCNDLPDDGIDCGSCPDASMALIARDGMTTFCVDLYEASRSDATLASPGSDDAGGATSRNAVIPWYGVGLDTASTACTTAGKRLCTTEEWTEACGGPLGFLYPYNPTTYDPVTCNGADTPDPDSVGPTASRLNCVSPEGPLDMSGNLEEWVQGGTTRGGAYDDANIQLRCTGVGESPDTTSPSNAVGFRCCADAVAE